MTLRAYAKINLGLHVVGKRPDGYHNIETVFHQIDLYDEIELVQDDGGVRFTSDAAELSTDNTNLCVQAVNVLRDLTGVHTGVEITLKKRIPIGAGLGGGSADAAAVLKGLCRLWTLDITEEELRTVSASLGSDVPFFLLGGTAYGTGRGDLLEPLKLSLPYWIVVVSPGLRVSTRWAYTTLRVQAGIQRENLPRLLSENIKNPQVLMQRLHNEFEPVVFQAFPEIRLIKERLLAGGAAFALMSGSGSSVFGAFEDTTTAHNIGRELSSRYRVSITEPFFTTQPS